MRLSFQQGKLLQNNHVGHYFKSTSGTK